jgi:hypothetical protein
LRHQGSTYGLKDHLQQKKPETIAVDAVHTQKDYEDSANPLSPSWEFIHGSGNPRRENPSHENSFFQKTNHPATHIFRKPENLTMAEHSTFRSWWDLPGLKFQ